MGISLSGSKSKNRNETSENMNQTQTFTPNAEFLNMTQGGLNQALGLMGGYGQTSGADVANYLNPYQDTISAGIQRAGQIAGNNNDAQAAAAGAFGGSGWGLLRGETQRGVLDAEAQSRAQGYNTALNAAMGERSNAANYDMGALQTYLQGLGLLGNWGTTNTTGTGNSLSKGSGTQFGASGSFKYGG